VDKLGSQRAAQERLEALASEFAALHDFEAVFNISAQKGHSLPPLRDYLAARSACYPLFTLSPVCPVCGVGSPAPLPRCVVMRCVVWPGFELPGAVGF
jgi:hypothetical protein